MSLFQRMKTPFGDAAEGEAAKPNARIQAIGSLLRRRREELELDLETVAEQLRIKAVYLEAIEAGRAEDLPGSTYAVGFVRAYSHYLGLDSDRVLERYKEAPEANTRPDLSLPVPLGARSLPGGPILLVGIILALCGYGTWYYLATGERSRPEQVAPVPAELEQQAERAEKPVVAAAKPPLPATRGEVAKLGTAPPAAVAPATAPQSVAAAPPAAATAPDGATQPAALGSGNTVAPAAAAAPAMAGQIEIRALADCWIQVRSPDQIIFSRVLKAGEAYRVPRAGLSLRTGNAGALAIAVDGKPAPPLGAVGTLRRDVALDPAALMEGKAVRG